MGFLERFLAHRVPEWTNAYVHIEDFLAIIAKIPPKRSIDQSLSNSLSELNTGLRRRRVGGFSSADSTPELEPLVHPTNPHEETENTFSRLNSDASRGSARLPFRSYGSINTMNDGYSSDTSAGPSVNDWKTSDSIAANSLSINVLEDANQMNAMYTRLGRRRSNSQGREERHSNSQGTISLDSSDMDQRHPIPVPRRKPSLERLKSSVGLNYPSNNYHPPLDQTKTWNAMGSHNQPHKHTAECLFYDLFHSDLQMVEAFYLSTESLLKKELEKLQKTSQFSGQGDGSSGNGQAKGGVSKRTAVHASLDVAFKELYRGVEMLNSYATLNASALLKVIDYHDRRSARQVATELAPLVELARFSTSSWMSNARQTLIDLYAQLFSVSQVAAAKRLTSTHQLVHSPLLMYEIGWLMGVAFCLALVLAFFVYVTPNDLVNYTAFVASAPLFRLLFVLVVLLYSWGAVLYVSHLTSVNVVFVLNADVRTALTYFRVWFLASALLVVTLGTMLGCLFLFLAQILQNTSPSDTASHPHPLPPPAIPSLPSATITSPYSSNLQNDSTYLNSTHSVSVTEGTAISVIVALASPHVSDPAHFYPSFLLQASVFIFLLILVFLPFNFFFHPTRAYLGSLLLRTFGTLYYPTTFESSFIGDQLCSLTKCLYDFVHAICFYLYNFVSAIQGDYLTCRPIVQSISLVIAFIPFGIRACQCVKRYASHGWDYRQLINTGKYLASILMTALTLIYRRALTTSSAATLTALSALPTFAPVHFHVSTHRTSRFEPYYPASPSTTSLSSSMQSNSTLINAIASALGTAAPLTPPTSPPLTPELIYLTRLRFAMAAASVFSTVYSYLWDLKMDWGLLELSSAFPLRKRSALPSHLQWVYYLAALLNLLLRLLWVEVLLPSSLGFSSGLGMQLWVATSMCAEVLRRMMWNYFRLENEHLNNVGEFRALNIKIPDVPTILGDTPTSLPISSKISSTTKTDPLVSSHVSISSAPSRATSTPMKTATASSATPNGKITQPVPSPPLPPTFVDPVKVIASLPNHDSSSNQSTITKTTTMTTPATLGSATRATTRVTTPPDIHASERTPLASASEQGVDMVANRPTLIQLASTQGMGAASARSVGVIRAKKKLLSLLKKHDSIL